jgi:anti-sigma regulatory factor (Ser/Thr protein kinase)
MRHSQTFENQAASVPAARRFATGRLGHLPPEVTEAVELMVSELATNCVVHADGGFEIAILQTPDNVRVEAIDNGCGEPQLRSPGPTDPHGRGLLIIDMLSATWGVDQRERQKVVWFTVRVPSPSTAKPEGLPAG